MKIPPKMPRLKGFRFPREIIAYTVWVSHRFALSTADVEDLLAERGVTVSRETVRQWVKRFGRHFADCIRRDRPRAANKWHLDEVVIPIHDLAPGADRRAHKGLNNRIEGSHRSTRKREKLMGRFKSPKQAQRFLTAHDRINTLFRPRRGFVAQIALGDSSCESSVIAGGHEQLVPYEVQDQKLVFVQHSTEAARFSIDLV